MAGTTRSGTTTSTWPKKLDAFLLFNERRILSGLGNTSREDADAHAEEQCERFAVQKREALEREGEAELESQAMNQLEEAARRWPKRRPKGS